MYQWQLSDTATDRQTSKIGAIEANLWPQANVFFISDPTGNFAAEQPQDAQKTT
jgi:hypothetical protein